jgi:hypothetical protein
MQWTVKGGDDATGTPPAMAPVLNASVAQGPQSASNKNDNLQHGTVVFDAKGAAACVGVSNMIKAGKAFPQDTVPSGVSKGSATSNSGARYLGKVGGFHPNEPNQHGLKAVGWGLRVPGVEN